MPKNKDTEATYRKSLLQSLSELIKENKVEEIKTVLLQLETRLSGYQDWYYDQYDYEVSCAVRDAIMLGRVEVLSLFLKAGASPNETAYENGSTDNLLPLIHFAAKTGDLNIVKMLVENGARICPDKPQDRRTWRNVGLSTAVMRGHTDIVAYLLERGADANEGRDGGTTDYMYGISGITYLAKAAQDGNLAVVEELFKHGADVKSSILLAYSELCVYGYRKYENILKEEYRQYQRIQVITTEFYFLRNADRDIYTLLIDEVKKQFEKLDYLMMNVDLNNHEDKNKIVIWFINELKHSDVEFNETRVSSDIASLIERLRPYYSKKLNLENIRNGLKSDYTRIVSTLMDYAIGYNFDSYREDFMSLKRCDGLDFLKDLDVSQINFIGTSLKGNPITRETLIHRSIQGTSNAIITMSDLMHCKDPIRQAALTRRLERLFGTKGKLIDSIGITNLVPLYSAAKIGDLPTVECRLLAGTDPNDEKLALIIAATNGYLEIVKKLTESHKWHTLHKIKILQEEAATRLSERSFNEVVCIQDGIVKFVPVHFDMKKYTPIVMHQNYSLTLHLLKRVSSPKLDKTISVIIKKAQQEGNHVVIRIKSNKKIEAIEYNTTCDRLELSKDLNKFIDSAESHKYFPILFTDIKNHDLIDVLIEAQYHKKDMSKKLFCDALQIAKNNKYMEIVEYLEEHLDVNQRNSDGESLLHLAIDKADLTRVKELIERGADINIKNKLNMKPIDLAIFGCSSNRKNKDTYLEFFNYFLEQNALIDIETIATAIKSENMDLIAQLIPLVKKESTREIIHHANGDKEIITKHWYVDLMYQAIKCNLSIEILNLLKFHGANFNEIGDQNRSLLCTVIYSLPSFDHIVSSMGRRLEMYSQCSRIDSSSIDMDYKRLIEKQRSILEKEIYLLSFLLDNGADPNVRDHDNNTPLYILLKEKDLCLLEPFLYIQLLDKFLLYDADINALCNNCSTLLHIAAITGNTIVVDYLIRHGANLNAKDSDGNTPLHCAVSKFFPTISKSLMEAGSDQTILNNQSLMAEELLERSYKNQKSELQSKRSEVYISYNFFSNSIRDSKCKESICHEKETLHKNYHIIKSAFKKREIKQSISP